MRFGLLTNPSLDNHVLMELLNSGLRPEFVVTSDPFYIKGPKNLAYFFNKLKVQLKFLLAKESFKQRFRPYFLAKRNSIKTYEASEVNTKWFADTVKNSSIDYLFTFGFRILKEPIIAAPKLGCINFHPAYLPFNRGASPSQWVLNSAQEFTGLSFHEITKGIDEGAIVEQHKIPLTGLENTKLLNQLLFGIGEQLLVQIIYRLKNGIQINTLINQLDQGSYERPFKNSDCIIDNRSSLDEIKRLIAASKDGSRVASYQFEGKSYNIRHCIELTGAAVSNKTPYLNNDKNIVILTGDSKTALLIVDRSK